VTIGELPEVTVKVVRWNELQSLRKQHVLLVVWAWSVNGKGVYIQICFFMLP